VLHEVEPLLAPNVDRAVLVEHARRVDPAAAVAAWAVAARHAGADIRTGTDVKRLLHRDGRVHGVLTDEGEVQADTVVVAAGPWSWRVCRSLPFDVPVRGVRGWLLTTRPAPFRLAHAIEEAWWGVLKSALVPPTVGDLATGAMPRPAVMGLLQQDAHARVLLGASLHAATGDHPEGVDALRGIAKRACELIPALRDVPIAETRTCQRPMSPDGLPLHGPVPGVDGLVLATGHGAQGVTWGPGAGEAVAHGIATGTWDVALLPARFV
jgi:glycine/D-amino acid oxidase-like deaminating enzyme